MKRMSKENEETIVQLPTAFIEKYQRLLKEEAPAFLAALTSGTVQSGFRANPLKPGQPTATIEAAAGQSPYVTNGYLGKVDGHSLDHVTGWVYSQEPSAMLVGEFADPQPGERVLDLCAAPGGKSTHLIAKMNDEGLLVANEIFKNRAQVLAENLERWGAKHVVVANESPDQLEKQFPAFFDRILVDTPCSGEGMFRKEPAGIEYWNEDYPAECANRQRHILTSALKMLKPGGTLVYSTCTFAPEEDEQMAAWLLNNYDLTMVELEKAPGMDAGRPEWADGNPELTKALRLFPHHFKGEGHFIAKFVKNGEEPVLPTKKNKKKKGRGQRSKFAPTKEQQALWQDFQTKVLPNYEAGQLVVFGDYLYDLPVGMPAIDQMSLIRPGLQLGVFKKNRFEPALALALATKPATCTQVVEVDEPAWRTYVHGDTLTIQDAPKNGWYLVECDQHAAGWGKLVNGTLKNFFPKGLRF